MYNEVLISAAAAKSLQPCPTLCDPIDSSPSGSPRPWDSPGKNTGVGCHFLLHGAHKIKCFPPKIRNKSIRSMLLISVHNVLEVLGQKKKKKLKASRYKDLSSQS